MAFSLSLSGSTVDCESFLLYLPIPHYNRRPVLISIISILYVKCENRSRGMSNVLMRCFSYRDHRWVVYEYSNFKGRQMLLTTGDYPMWTEHSGWDTIGSLQPLGRVRPGHTDKNVYAKNILSTKLKSDKPTLCGCKRSRSCLPQLFLEALK